MRRPRTSRFVTPALFCAILVAMYMTRRDKLNMALWLGGIVLVLGLIVRDLMLLLVLLLWGALAIGLALSIADVFRRRH